MCVCRFHRNSHPHSLLHLPHRDFGGSFRMRVWLRVRIFFVADDWPALRAVRAQRAFDSRPHRKCILYPNDSREFTGKNGFSKFTNFR